MLSIICRHYDNGSKTKNATRNPLCLIKVQILMRFLCNFSYIVCGYIYYLLLSSFDRASVLRQRELVLELELELEREKKNSK